MIVSMTGFGKATAHARERIITVEIRSLNSKQLDINTRLPWFYRDREHEIRNVTAQALERGKIDVYINCEQTGEEPPASVNSSIVSGYFRQIKEISESLDIPLDSSIMPAILRLPDSVGNDAVSISDQEWSDLMEALTLALERVKEYRLEEGSSLEADIREAVHHITGRLDDIEPREENRRLRIRDKLTELMGGQGAKPPIDQNRLEQEILFYVERYDINEEKVRLKKHCDYFLETLNSESSGGKRLQFIAQEMSREINTIGSKANDADIQRVVVDMKEHAEKIREQLFNVL